MTKCNNSSSCPFNTQWLLLEVGLTCLFLGPRHVYQYYENVCFQLMANLSVFSNMYVKGTLLFHITLYKPQGSPLKKFKPEFKISCLFWKKSKQNITQTLSPCLSTLSILSILPRNCYPVFVLGNHKLYHMMSFIFIALLVLNFLPYL